ncbi:MAG: pyridoxal-phosphate dependent enzyme [Paracoccaceae bacterium]|nr:pyridoxal-phosphate dependent enzyme [Paracoccaceae bacterium]
MLAAAMAARVSPAPTAATRAAVMGRVFAVLRRSSFRPLAMTVGFIVEFIRGTPLLMQLYFIFFVLPDIGLRLPPITAGVIGLGLHYATYTAEVYRGGIENVAKRQWEAARATNLSMRQTWLHVILPQAVPPDLADAAAVLGVPAVVCLSHLVPANKVAVIRALGAEVRVIGASQDEAMDEVARCVAQEGLNEISPFDDARVVAGQGTLGLEIAEDCPDLELVLVPWSGGGLALGAAMAASLAAGHPVQVTDLASLADSLGGGVGLANAVTFAMCRALLDDVILLSEAEIAAGMRHAARIGETIEGAAAVGIAAILAGKVAASGPVVAILSGQNVDPALHARVMAGANSVKERQ